LLAEIRKEISFLRSNPSKAVGGLGAIASKLENGGGGGGEGQSSKSSHSRVDREEFAKLLQ
jgi:hypothetical protein